MIGADTRRTLALLISNSEAGNEAYSAVIERCPQTGPFAAAPATLRGSCELGDGAVCSFEATVEDNGDPGTGVDRFRLLSSEHDLVPAVAALAPHLPLAGRIEAFWADPASQRARSWIDHREINMVMLATSGARRLPVRLRTAAVLEAEGVGVGHSLELGGRKQRDGACDVEP